MQKWEYMTVYRTSGNEGGVSHINEKPVGKITLFGGWKGQDFFEFLNRAGQEGWEVVGMAEGYNYSFYLVLKRPIE